MLNMNSAICHLRHHFESILKIIKCAVGSDVSRGSGWGLLGWGWSGCTLGPNYGLLGLGFIIV